MIRFLTLILATFICFGNTKAQNLSSDTPVTEFSLYKQKKQVPQEAFFYTADQTPVFLSSFKGKVVVLNFFKATCLKCLIEMPSLNELKDKYPDIILLAISEGEETPEVVDMILHKERRMNNIDVSLDEKQKLFFLLGGDKVPQTRLIDKDGFIRGYIKGEADFRSEKINTQIQELLDE